MAQEPVLGTYIRDDTGGVLHLLSRRAGRAYCHMHADVIAIEDAPGINSHDFGGGSFSLSVHPGSMEKANESETGGRRICAGPFPRLVIRVEAGQRLSLNRRRI